MNYDLIFKIIHSFYDVARKDILIGYHFNGIEDFDTHIERITRFWFLQLNGKVLAKEDLPYKLLEVHQVLPIKRGEVDRWMLLFKQNIDLYSEVSDEDKALWLNKAEKMRDKIIQQAGLQGAF